MEANLAPLTNSRPRISFLLSIAKLDALTMSSIQDRLAHVKNIVLVLSGKGENIQTDGLYITLKLELFRGCGKILGVCVLSVVPGLAGP